MISAKMAERLNEQLNLEFSAFYKYLSMSAYCSTLSLNGFAGWFRAQALEEQVHAMKIYDYILEQDSSVNLLPLKMPESNFKNVAEAIQMALENEKQVTKSINELVGFAVDEKDHATNIFLQWFVTEQVEEEASLRDILDNLKLAGDSGEGLLILDREMGKRPSPSA